jgi:hypothetical protein
VVLTNGSRVVVVMGSSANRAAAIIADVWQYLRLKPAGLRTSAVATTSTDPLRSQSMLSSCPPSCAFNDLEPSSVVEVSGLRPKS